jgi:sugar phosphate isomerase/epimerase
MHIGCCAYSYRDALNAKRIALTDFLRLCAEMGLDGVELTAYYFTDLSDSHLREIKREAYRRGLEISGTAVGNAFTSPEEAKRREQVQMVKDWIDRSVTLGAPGIRVFAGSTAPGTEYEQAVEWTAACLRECAAYGEARGVMLALENHGGITATADQTLRLLQAADHDWIGINLDLGNYAESPMEEIAKTAPYAVTAHAKVTAGSRTLDYGEIFRTLREAGYNGYVNVEYEEKEDPFVAVPSFVARLQAALRQP